MIKLGQTSHNIPCVLVTVDWASIVGPDGAGPLPLAALEALAHRLATDSSFRYAQWAPGTITEGPVSVQLSEPVTPSTRFLCAAGPIVEASVPITIALQPSLKTARTTSVKAFQGAFFEPFLCTVLAGKIRAKLTRAAAGAKPSLVQKAVLAESRLAEMIASGHSSYTPMFVAEATPSHVKVTTRAASWPDPATRASINLSSVNTALTGIITGSMSESVRAVATPIVRAQVERSTATLASAVDIQAAATRSLSAGEMAVLEESVGDAFALPLFVMSVVGEMGRTYSVGAFYDALSAIWKTVPNAVDAVIDIDNSPRTVAEFVRSVTGTSDTLFLSGIEAVYRRRSIPVLPETLPDSVKDALRSLHPALIPEADITGPRTVHVSGAGYSETLTYPEDGTPYSLRASSAPTKTAAVQALNKYHAFLNACSALLIARAATSPEVLRDYGVQDVVRGAVYGLPA